MLKIVDKLHLPLSLVINRRSALLKNEDIAYVSAFLAGLRQKLLPLRSKSLSHCPRKDEINKIYSELYNELNELYIDEHMTMANNDYLEQCYEIFSNIHKLVRKYEIVYDLKLEENRKKFHQNDPDSFPIYNLTGSDSIPEYKTIWELKADFKEEFEELNGHYLYLRKSKIEHPDANKGVFLSCKDRKFVLPGTLLGFYPGVIHFSFLPTPKLEVNSTYPYLKRYDGVWLDPEKKIPYPLNPILSLEENFEMEADACEITGIKELNNHDKLVPISYLNPLSLGHKINHPPPDTEANVKFIDISIPYNFFPAHFLRYLPNIYECQNKKTNQPSGTATKYIRSVAIISLTEIKHDQELFVDYIEEDLIPDTYRPDWLLQPPPRNPYLIKQEYTTKPNVLDKIAHKIYQISYGKENIEFKKYIKREEGLDLIRSNENIKRLRKELQEGTKLLENSHKKSQITDDRH